MTTMIHPTAIIDPNAVIGPDCEIGPFCLVGADVKLGARNHLRSHVVMEGHTSIGAENVFFSGTAIGTPPQDLKYAGEPTRLEIGDRNLFRECVTVNRGTVSGHGVTVIGSDCLFMAYAHVAHDCRLGNFVIMANAATLAGHVTIDDCVTIGGLTPIQQFVRIGEHAFIGGATRVSQDIVPYIKMGGIPPVVLGCNHIGLSRRGFSPETIQAIEKTLKILFRSGLNTTQAVARLREEKNYGPKVEKLIRFVETAEHGILRN